MKRLAHTQLQKKHMKILTPLKKQGVALNDICSAPPVTMALQVRCLPLNLFGEAAWGQ